MHWIDLWVFVLLVLARCVIQLMFLACGLSIVANYIKVKKKKKRTGLYFVWYYFNFKLIFKNYLTSIYNTCTKTKQSFLLLLVIMIACYCNIARYHCLLLAIVIFFKDKNIFIKKKTFLFTKTTSGHWNSHKQV